MSERAYEHACGGWYLATEDAEGYHRAPSDCSDCYDSREAAERARARREAFLDEQADADAAAQDDEVQP
jgi:hypothetical protein